MLQNQEGRRVPDVTFRTRRGDQWVNVTSAELFGGRKVVVFALPGAFTPTCSSSHLPRYNELVPVFRQHGIDDVICLSVNDAFVMNAWQAEQDAKNVTFIPDGNGDFSRGMGMLVDKSELGFGQRSWRYSMLVNDGVIEKMFVEPEVPGDPFRVSDADTMLCHVAPDCQLPARVTVFTKPGCPYCVTAKDTLRDAGIHFEEIELGRNGVSYSSLQAVTGRGTTPQIFVDGRLVGGSDELAQWLGARSAA